MEREDVRTLPIVVRIFACKPTNSHFRPESLFKCRIVARTKRHINSEALNIARMWVH